MGGAEAKRRARLDEDGRDRSRADSRQRAEERATSPDLSERLLRLMAYIYIAAIPLDSLSFYEGRSLSGLAGLVLLGAWGFDILSVGAGSTKAVGKRESAKLLYFSIVAFLVWYLLSFSWSVNPSAGQERLFSYLGLALSVPALARGLRDAGLVPVAVYSASSILLAIVTLVEWAGSGSLGTSRLSAAGLNDNQMSLMLVVGAAFCVLLANSSLGLRRVFFSVSAVGCSLAALTTGSKTGLVALVVLAIGMPLLVSGGDARARMSRALSVGALIAVGGAVLWVFRGLLPDRLLNTGDDFVSGNLTTREDIWESALYYRDLWLPWGMGPGNTQELVGFWYGQGKGSHNTFLGLGIELGVLGIVLALLFFAGVIGASRWSPYRSFILSALIPLIIYSLSTDLFHYKILWFVAALAVVRPLEAAPHKAGPSG